MSSDFLRRCQATYNSDIRGTVSPWVLNEDDAAREDIHDTLQAIYIWSRKENVDQSEDCLDMALDFVKRSFTRYKQQGEPIKSYDSAFHLLALHNYLKSHRDRYLQEIENYAKNYLVSYFKKQPPHDQREFSNPYWKASILYLVMKDNDESIGFIKEWVRKDLSLVKPENEPDHRGMGYKYSHDFFSTFGTKLFAFNLILPEFKPETVEPYLPDGFVNRTVDEVPFNASILFGLTTMRKNLTRELDYRIGEISREIFSNLENRVFEGGIKRGDYTQLREAWPTFFVYFAELLRERLPVFQT